MSVTILRPETRTEPAPIATQLLIPEIAAADRARAFWPTSFDQQTFWLDTNDSVDEQSFVQDPLPLETVVVSLDAYELERQGGLGMPSHSLEGAVAYGIHQALQARESARQELHAVSSEYTQQYPWFVRKARSLGQTILGDFYPHRDPEAKMYKDRAQTQRQAIDEQTSRILQFRAYIGELELTTENQKHLTAATVSPDELRTIDELVAKTPTPKRSDVSDEEALERLTDYELAAHQQQKIARVYRLEEIALARFERKQLPIAQRWLSYFRPKVWAEALEARALLSKTPNFTWPELRAVQANEPDATPTPSPVQGSGAHIKSV